MDYSRLIEGAVDEYLAAKGHGGKTVVYHGTTSPSDILPLDINKTSPKGMFGRGVYTTTHPDVASGFARKKTVGADSDSQRPRVYPFVLNTKRPLDANEYELDNDQLGVLGLKGRGLFRASRTLDQLRVQNSELIPHFHSRIPKIGFDSITHKGGVVFGDIPHQVHIVYDKTGLIPMFDNGKPLRENEDYSRLIEEIVTDLLEVGVLPDSVISKAASGGWEKKEVNPGEVSPLAKSGIRSPRVNMGMSTPTTTFLPFAGLSPAVKEVRARSGDPDVQLVPGAAESSAVLLRTAPKAPMVRQMSAVAGKTPHEFTSDVGRKHLIVLGPAKKMKAGVESQKAIFGHEAGHVLKRDTTKYSNVKMFDRDISDEDIVSDEENAWKTGNALLKDMGISSDPHMEKAALHTYYTAHAENSPKADITNLNPDEASTLLHLLKQPDSYYPHTFRMGSKIHRGPDNYMQDRYKHAMGKPLDEVTLPKDTSVEGLTKGLDRAHVAWTKEMDTTTDLNNPKLAALSDNYVYFDNLMTAAGYPPEVAPKKMQNVLKQAKLQQAIKRK